MKAAIDILLVEDSPTDVLLAREALSTNRFQIQSSQRLSDALRLLTAKSFDVILLDLGLPDSQGLETLRTLRINNSHIAVVVLTGKDDEELAAQALHEGAQDYLIKAELQPNLLQRSIRYAVERSGAENKVRQIEQRVQEMTEHIDQVLWIIDTKECNVLYVSQGYEKMFGRSCQTLMANPQSYMEGIDPQDQALIRRQVATIGETGHIDVECRVIQPNGTMRWGWIRGYPVKENDIILRLVGVVEDVTEKKRLELERDTLLSRLQLHIQRLPVAYILFGPDGRIMDWNPTAERIFGYTKNEMLGKGPPHEELVPPSFWEKGEKLRNRIRAGEMDAHSLNENLTKAGRTILCQWFNTPLFEDDGRFIGFLCLAQDVTEQKSLESQLRQAQKMEAIGQLAGGVAHDFNNLLTVISGYSDILLSSIAPDDPMREPLKAISEAGERAAMLTRQLLAFSRKTVLEPKILDLNEVVRETAKLLRRLIGEDILQTAVLDSSISRVKVDPGQLGQVLMNLAVNARDAMPKGGKLTIETRNVELDENYTRLRPEVQPGPYVLLSISDTGVGMTAEVKERIFEPFFTTKRTGEGTGLGLAVVLGIVKQSGGHVEVYSEPNIGTTFKVYFPAIREKVSVSKVTEISNGGHGTETILIVEDEDSVRKLGTLVLQNHGYKVFAAGSGKDAIQLLDTMPDKVDLLVTDVVMPGMDGPDLVEALHPRFPSMKVLFSSGYTDDAVVRHGLLQEKVAFLQKPYSAVSLVKKVREVLDKQ